MKVKKITRVGKRNVYDISVDGVCQYILENGAVCHNTGNQYSSDNIWILGRQQDKDSDGINGYHFIINVEKSRFVKEKSKIPITVSYEGGIVKWSGLLDIALEGGYITKPKNGWYARVNMQTKELYEPNMRESQIVNNADFWKTIFAETDFADYVRNKYQLPESHMMDMETTIDSLNEEVNKISNVD